jgi:hypothetical protein
MVPMPAISMRSWRAMPLRRRSLLGLLPVGGMAAGCAGPWAGRQRRELGGLTDYALSPDGQVLATLQKDDWNSGGERRRIERLVLYQWSSGAIDLVPLPDGQTFSWVQFAPDGRSLAVIRFRYRDRAQDAAAGLTDILSMNLGDFSTRPVAAGLRGHVWSPRFSSDGRFLAFGVRPHIGQPQIVLQPVTGAATRNLLPEPNHYYGLGLVGFRGADEFLFTLLRADGSLQAEAADLGYRQFEGATFTVRLLPDGASPPRIARPQPDDRWPGASPSGLCASGDGSVLAWTARTEEKPNGPYRYDAFERRDGEVRRLTELNTFTGGCAISRDAGTVAFSESPGRTTEFDLTVVDTRTRRVTRTGLLERLRRIPPAAEPIRVLVPA